MRFETQIPKPLLPLGITIPLGFSSPYFTYKQGPQAEFQPRIEVQAVAGASWARLLLNDTISKIGSLCIFYIKTRSQINKNNNKRKDWIH